jgi:DNA-directed RNA polymerase specialized sigma24 family protein
MAAAAEGLETDRRLLWGLCYRMTGNAADADDLSCFQYVTSVGNMKS